MSAKSDRDQSIERLLKQSFAAGDIAPGPCLDAETVAAWMEGALPGEERARAEEHLSSCGTCQAMIAAVAKLPPVAAPRGSRSGGWTVRWLVPLAACGIAVGVWVALPDRSGRQSAPVAVAQRPAAESSPAPQPEPRPDRAQPSVPDRRGGVESGPTDTTTRAPRLSASAARELEERRKAASVAAADAVATAAAQRQALVSRDIAALQQQAANESLDKAAGTTPRASPSSVLGRSPAPVGRVATFRREVAPVEIPSPDQAVRWRIGVVGFIQRTTDGGATWEVISTGLGADLLAGASPSPSVCWLTGRTGTVLLIVDGRRVQRVTFPEAVDLTGVRATNERAAVVTTVDGRSFSTTDGGASWQLQTR